MVKLEHEALIVDVVDLLEGYEGEEIVAYQHPLHEAVRRLEEICRPENTLTPHLGNEFRGQIITVACKQNKLFNPACIFWFSLLWASREGEMNRCPDGCIWGTEANPSLACYYAHRLQHELLEWLQEEPPFVE